MTTRQTWQATTPLLPHQQDAVAKLLPVRVGALFAEMGTGKTRMAIELVRLRQHKLDRVVYFCPVSLKDTGTIAHEIRKHTDCTDADLYEFGERTRERTVPADAFWYIVGIESMSSSARAIFAARQLITERTFVIVDESTYIKGHRSLRTERITAMAQHARYRLILAGIPFSQGVVDLYAQMRFLDPAILGYHSFHTFARNHLEYSEQYPGHIVRVHNIPYLAAKIQPYIYQVTKEECLHLPEKLYETRMCQLTASQQSAYAEAKRLLLEAVEPDDWGRLVIFRLFTALQGIVCGFWKRPDGVLEEYPHHRIDALLDVISALPAGERVIIWSRFRYAQRQIADALSAAYGADTVSQLHGGFATTRRKLELSQWRSSGRYLVATTGVGGHGLTLNEARYVIFYANGFKFSERLQAEDRNHRIGQGQRPVYIDLRSSAGIEHRIFQALANKENALHRFRAEVEKIKKQGTKDKLRALVKGL